MIKIIGCAILVFHLHFAVSQVLEDDIPSPSTHGSNRPRPSDPVSTFLSGLGNLMLDIDATFARQTAPKVNAEDRMKEQMYGRPRSGTSYFNRIRENYRDIQRRLGESLGILDVSMSSDLGSVNVQNKNQESSVDVSLPFLPVKLSVNSNPGVKESRKAEELTEPVATPTEEVSPRFASSFKLGNTNINIDSNLDPIRPSELLKTVEDQITKTLEDMGLANRRLEIAQPKDNLQEKTVDRREQESELNLAQEQFSARSGSELVSSEPPQTVDSNPEGRILGDILYSESAFDKLTKRVMKDTKWAIDPKVFPSRAVEKLKRLSDKATESKEKADNSKDVPFSNFIEGTISDDQQKRENLKTDFKKRKSLTPLGNSLENTLNNENINFISQPDVKVEFDIVDNRRRQDVIILAFTPEGVPLKLRMGPEIVNPLKFLHKSLGTYGVSLNIPVMSYDDIEPVGREVLQLGTGSGGIMTRALYIDLSDSFQLESLLRTLKRTKMFQKMRKGADADV